MGYGERPFRSSYIAIESSAYSLLVAQRQSARVCRIHACVCVSDAIAWTAQAGI